MSKLSRKDQNKIKQYYRLRMQRKEIDAKMKRLKEEIYEDVDWGEYEFGSFKVNVMLKKRKIVDYEKIKAALGSRYESMKKEIEDMVLNIKEVK